MHSGRPLAHFWRPWASKWLTFGSPWLPFGSLLTSFVYLLAPFGSLRLTFGALFEEIMKTLINSIHFHEFARLVNNFYDFSCFSRHISKEYTQQPDSRTIRPLLDLPLPLGPERNLAVRNLDPLWARRRPGRVRVRRAFPIF